jgi:hypothetical protein
MPKSTTTALATVATVATTNSSDNNDDSTSVGIESNAISSTKTVTIETPKKTVPLDDCFIFTLIDDRKHWSLDEIVVKKSKETKKILKIKIGMMDGSLSYLNVWGDGNRDTVINWVLTYFR